MQETFTYGVNAFSDLRESSQWLTNEAVGGVVLSKIHS